MLFRTIRGVTSPPGIALTMHPAPSECIQLRIKKAGTLKSLLLNGEWAEDGNNILHAIGHFDMLYQVRWIRSQPPVEEGICGQVYVPYSSSAEAYPDALHPDTPPVFFVRRRECGSAQIIQWMANL